MQDPGAVTLILLVRDLEAAFTKLKAAGVPVVTTGGVPLAMSATNKTRAVIVQDPDGHFVELAQLDPLPATTAPASSNVIGIRLRVTVADMDGTLRFYQERLGLTGELRPFASTPLVSAMMGLPVSEYRLAHDPVAELAAAPGAVGAERDAARRGPLAGPGSGLLPSAGQRPRHRRGAGRDDGVGQHRGVEQSRPGVDDLRVAALAAGGRARSQQPVPGRAAAAARVGIAGRASTGRATGLVPGIVARRRIRRSSASTASRATTRARERRTWRSMRWISRPWRRTPPRGRR